MQLIAVQQAVPVLAGIIGCVGGGEGDSTPRTTPPQAAAEPGVCLAAVKLLGALASTHTEGRLQVRGSRLRNQQTAPALLGCLTCATLLHQRGGARSALLHSARRPGLDAVVGHRPTS